MKTIFIALIFICTFSLTIIGKFVVIGNNSSEEQLVYPGKILEGPDNNIYIYDRQDAFIKVFSPQGKMVRKIGGKGEGPGQFKRADGADFGFTPDGRSIWFTEYFMGHPWMSFVDLKGKPGKFINYEFSGFFGIPEAEISGDGTIFVRVQTPSQSIKKGDIFYTEYRDELHILRKNGKTMSVDLSRESITTISYIKSGGDIGVPFCPRFLWAITSNGKILFSEGTSEKLFLYNRKGEVVSRIEVPIPRPSPVTKKDLHKWKVGIRERFKNRNRSWYKQFGSVIEKYNQSVHQFKPVISKMDITPDNNILLQCLTEKNGEFIYLLTDLKGKLLARFRSDITRVYLSKNFIVLQTVSEEEELEISFIKRSGGEKGDLLRIFGVSH